MPICRSTPARQSPQNEGSRRKRDGGVTHGESMVYLCRRRKRPKSVDWDLGGEALGICLSPHGTPGRFCITRQVTMTFLCPDCAAKCLDIASRLELGPDCRSDEITLQTVECSQCGFAGIAVYQESRRGALDSESFDHYGYHVTQHDLETIVETIKRCPEPSNWRCNCPAHRALGSRDPAGRWNGLNNVRRERAFALRF